MILRRFKRVALCRLFGLCFSVASTVEQAEAIEHKLAHQGSLGHFPYNLFDMSFVKHHEELSSIEGLKGLKFCVQSNTASLAACALGIVPVQPPTSAFCLSQERSAFNGTLVTDYVLYS